MECETRGLKLCCFTPKTVYICFCSLMCPLGHSTILFAPTFLFNMYNSWQSSFFQQIIFTFLSNFCNFYSVGYFIQIYFNINDDLNDLCTSAVSPNTTKATRYALNVWRYWCMTNGLKDHTDITKVRNS